MSGLTEVTNPRQFTQRRVIPLPDGFMRVHNAENHFTNIRKHDLVVVTRRVEPRPLPPRDMARAYNTELAERKTYVSCRESRDTRNLAEYERRPLDTRRQYVKTFISVDKVPVALDHENMSRGGNFY